MPICINAFVVQRDLAFTGAQRCRIDVRMNMDGTIAIGIGDKEYICEAESLAEALDAACELQTSPELMH